MSNDRDGKTGVQEWAEHSLNIISGCPNRCLYGYCSEMSIRFKRKTPTTWPTEELRPGFFDAEGKLTRKFGKRKGRIMFPTTHDVTPTNLKYCLPVLKALLEAGNHVLITTKPDQRAIHTLVEELQGPAMDPWTNYILFRFTIGSGSDETLSFWEPGAPSLASRMESLALATEAGFKTSVSMEPILDTTVGQVVDHVDLLAPLVTDTIWLGTANKLRARCKCNGHMGRYDVRDAVNQLEEAWTLETVRELHSILKHHPKVRWKNQIKTMLGL